MAIQSLACLIAEAFNDDPLPAPVAVTGRRRKKLWELPPHWHGPLLATCLAADEIRRMAQRAGIDQSGMGDFVLHSQVINACSYRSGIADMIQHRLDQRFAIVIARFARSRGTDSTLELWQRALASGDVGGALWAASSHPDIDEDDGNAIYGDVYMLAHQSVLPAKADSARLAALELSNANLREKLAALRRAVDTAGPERAIADLKKRLAETEQGSVLHAREARELAEGNAVLELRIAALNQQIGELEQANAECARRADESTAELEELRDELAATTSALAAAMALCEEPTTRNRVEDDRSLSSPALAGRCVVCVGGRTGLIDQYRRLVESRGARFIHHDGGQEESMHRIDAVLAGADIVVCQSSCVSHSAYWRLKDACKRRKLPCVFLKSTGITSFARSLETFAGEGSARRQAN